MLSKKNYEHNPLCKNEQKEREKQPNGDLRSPIILWRSMSPLVGQCRGGQCRLSLDKMLPEGSRFQACWTRSPSWARRPSCSGSRRSGASTGTCRATAEALKRDVLSSHLPAESKSSN